MQYVNQQNGTSVVGLSQFSSNEPRKLVASFARFIPSVPIRFQLVAEMGREFRALHHLISGPQPPARLHARDRRQERRTEARGQGTGGKIFDDSSFE